MQAFGHIKNKMAYEQLETQRFIRRHGITDFKFNPFFPVNTLHLMRMAVAAQNEGILPRYMDAVFHHMWERAQEDGRSRSRQGGARRIRPRCRRCSSAPQAPEVKAALIANTEDAVARGVFGIPTFFVGDEMFFGKDRLRDVEEAIRRPPR